MSEAIRLDDGCRLAAAKDVVSRVVEGEAVLLDLASGKYFGLNEVGSCVWEHLAEPVTMRELIEHVLGEFDVDEGTARADLEALLADLARHGLIQLNV